MVLINLLSFVLLDRIGSAIKCSYYPVFNYKSLFNRYFANGICRVGDACRYLHQGEPVVRDTSPRRVTTTGARCRYYQRGRCTYGQRCRFSHANDLSSNSSTNSLNQNMASSSSSSSSRKSHTSSENRNGQGQRYSSLKNAYCFRISVVSYF